MSAMSGSDGGNRWAGVRLFAGVFSLCLLWGGVAYGQSSGGWGEIHPNFNDLTPGLQFNYQRQGDSTEKTWKPSFSIGELQWKTPNPYLVWGLGLVTSYSWDRQALADAVQTTRSFAIGPKLNWEPENRLKAVPYVSYQFQRASIEKTQSSGVNANSTPTGGNLELGVDVPLTAWTDATLTYDNNLRNDARRIEQFQFGLTVKLQAWLSPPAKK